MENDFPTQSTNQLLIQYISEAAVFTDPRFAIIACNPAASALFLYNQQDVQGHSISLLASTSSTTNSQPAIQKLKKCGDASVLQKTGDALKVLNETDNDVAKFLFRIYQEALTNIARHANAKTVFSPATG